MTVLNEKERKTLGPYSSLKTWMGAVHFRVLGWKDDHVYTAYCDIRAEAEEIERSWIADGIDTSGIQVHKGRCPTEDEIEAARQARIEQDAAGE